MGHSLLNTGAMEHSVSRGSAPIHACVTINTVLPTRQLPFCFQGMPLMMPAEGLDKLNRRNPRQRLVGIPVFTPYRRQLAVRAPGTVAPAQLAFDTQQAGINVVVAVLGTQNIVVHLVYPDRRTPVPVAFTA